MRLIQYVASTGLCSRRKAGALIKQGIIQVNNLVTTDPSTLMKPHDQVCYQNRTVRPENMIYLVLNKPKDYITTNHDGKRRKTIFDLLPRSIPQRLHAVGRLDRTTIGLLILTNDGQFTQRLAHPRNGVPKTYHATLDTPLQDKHLVQLRNGVILHDGPMKIDAIAPVAATRGRVIALTIHSGRNHIVRRLFEHVGYVVTKLDRVQYAGITKRGLPVGTWRHLHPNEVRRLRGNSQ